MQIYLTDSGRNVQTQGHVSQFYYSTVPHLNSHDFARAQGRSFRVSTVYSYLNSPVLLTLLVPSFCLETFHQEAQQIAHLQQLV